MSGLDDDALRDMLSARADRVPQTTAAEVMATVRAEVRGPRQGAAFSVLPVLTGRMPAIGAGWAAAAMIAVLVMVIVATRPPADSPSASASLPVTAAGSVSTTPPSPSTASATAASASPEPSSPAGHLSLADLQRSISDGSLDGRLVLIESTLRVEPVACIAGGGGCPFYGLDLVGAVVTTMREGLPVVPATPAAGSTPLTGTFIVVPYKGSLILVGRAEGSLASPVMPSAVTGSYQPPDPGGAIALQAIDGILDQDAHMPCTSNGDCSPPAITWTYPTPQSNGAAGGAMLVRLDEPALGIDPSIRKVPGPLLVRTGTGSRAEVVARYDVGSYTTVDMPSVSCHLAAGTKLPDCHTVVAHALAGVPSNLAITSVEVEQGAYCAPGTACPTAAREPDRAHVIVRSSNGGDWLLALVYGPDGSLVSSTSAPLPPESPAPSSVTTTCAEIGYGQITTLTCDAAIAAALRVVPAGTAITSLEFRYGSHCPPWLFCAMTPFDPNAGAVIVHVLAPGRDLWVTVRADAAGVVTAGQPVKFPKTYPKNSPVPTTCRELPSGSSSLLTCDVAVAAALDAVPAGTSIVSMDFAFGGTCPPWAWCAYAPNPNAGRVIVHVASPGPDLWVSVAADAAGDVRALSTPFPAGYSTGSPAP